MRDCVADRWGVRGRRFCCQTRDEARRIARVQAMRGGPPALVEQWSKGPVRWGPDTGLGCIASTKRTVHIADLTTEKAYRERDPLRVVSVDVLGARTFLAVPILKDDILVGAIVIYRQEVRPFTDNQIDLSRILRRKPSSPSRMRGCSMNCANHCSGKRRPLMCSRSSADPHSICRPCLTR